MFCRRRNPLIKLLFVLFGLKFLTRERWTEEEKATYRAKRREFRHKMREAFDVWDEPVRDSESGESESQVES